MTKTVEITIGNRTYAINTEYVMAVENVGTNIRIYYAYGVEKSYEFSNVSYAVDAYRAILEVMNNYTEAKY